jgi:excisionase family DNA binding protein
MDMSGYLTTQQVAERLGRSQRQVQHLIEQGRLLAARVGHAYLVHESTLETFSLRRSGPPRKTSS